MISSFFYSLPTLYMSRAVFEKKEEKKNQKQNYKKPTLVCERLSYFDSLKFLNEKKFYREVLCSAYQKEFIISVFKPHDKMESFLLFR